MPKLTVIEDGVKRELYFEGEKLLSELIQNIGSKLSHPCGGKGSCKKCGVIANGKEVLSCRFKISDDTEVIIPEVSEISSVTGAEETGKLTDRVCLCLDIGTTTLALALVSTDGKNIIRTVTDTNPQRSFGADVISRIEYCSKNGVSDLRDSVVNAINAMVKRLFDEFKLSSVPTMYVAGNTTMLHCFFGVDCSSMGVSPYTPTFVEAQVKKGSECGIVGVENVVSLPSVSAFVGADIVAGINYVDLPETGKYSLLVDLGTNAEIVVFDSENLLCTAAAAGPCFEGVNISCGMSASDGAVCAYFSDGKYDTVGGAVPKGICATGLVDIIAEAVRNETIDESGYMEDDLVISDGVMLTPKDVREFQLAKSAVLSAIECLLEKLNADIEDVDKIYVAGGFSAALKVKNAVFVGLLPKGSESRFVPVNNSSLLGTVRFACENSDLSFVKNARYIDVSADGSFSDKFFENMYFA